MQILLISGHGAGDPGALGCGYREADLTRELVNLIAPKLRKYASVDVYDQKRNAFSDAKKGKLQAGAYDYALEIHFNAFSDPKAHGTEIYVTSKEKGIGVEKTIMQKLKKYFTLRDADGVKVADFLVIRSLKARGISSALLEVCFITNETEMKVYQGSKEMIANDIVTGIAEGFKLKPTGEVKPDPAPTYKTHKLSAEDTLWSLAVKYLGDGSRWTEISELNGGLDPRKLTPGKTIKIPNK